MLERAMKLILNSAEIRLLENAPISLRNAAGKQITCAAGTLWITFAGNAGDLFLVAGESCHVKGNGLVVAEAIGSASVRIDGPQNIRPLWMSLRNWYREFCPSLPAGHARVSGHTGRHGFRNSAP
ncbi:MAG: DUF2917 domain-containing protein [Azonexus sp.]